MADNEFRARQNIEALRNLVENRAQLDGYLEDLQRHLQDHPLQHDPRSRSQRARDAVTGWMDQNRYIRWLSDNLNPAVRRQRQEEQEERQQRLTGLDGIMAQIQPLRDSVTQARGHYHAHYTPNVVRERRDRGESAAIIQRGIVQDGEQDYTQVRQPLERLLFNIHENPLFAEEQAHLSDDETSLSHLHDAAALNQARHPHDALPRIQDFQAVYSYLDERHAAIEQDLQSIEQKVQQERTRLQQEIHENRPLRERLGEWYGRNRYQVKVAGVALTTGAATYTLASFADGLLTIPLGLMAAWVAGLGWKNIRELTEKRNNPDHEVDQHEDHRRFGYAAAAATVGLAGAVPTIIDMTGSYSLLERLGHVAKLGALGTAAYLTYRGLYNREAAYRRSVGFIQGNPQTSILDLDDELRADHIPAAVTARALREERGIPPRHTPGLVDLINMRVAQFSNDGHIIIPASWKYVRDTGITFRDLGQNIGEVARDGYRGLAYYTTMAPGRLALGVAGTVAAVAGVEAMAHLIDPSTQPLRALIYHAIYGSGVIGLSAANTRTIVRTGEHEADTLAAARVASEIMSRRHHRGVAHPSRTGTLIAGGIGLLLLAGGAVAAIATFSDSDKSLGGVYTDGGQERYGELTIPAPLPWPVVNADDSNDTGRMITSRYGSRRGGLNMSAEHKGTDIAPTSDAPYDVLAMLDGVVVKTNPCEGQVSIYHGIVRGEPLSSTYFHAETIAVQPGQHVKAGQVLGRMGGRSMPPKKKGSGSCTPYEHSFVSSNFRVGRHAHVEVRLGDDNTVLVDGSPVQFAPSQYGSAFNLECLLGKPEQDYALNQGLAERQPIDLDTACAPIRKVVGYK